MFLRPRWTRQATTPQKWVYLSDEEDQHAALIDCVIPAMQSGFFRLSIGLQCTNKQWAC